MPANFDNVHIIINPAAGKNEPVLNTLNKIFNTHFHNWEVSITHQKGDGQRLAQNAIHNGADLVIAYGGDGTAMDVANGVMGHHVPLGILPGGTGNALAAEMGIPRDLKKAAEMICSGRWRTHIVDVGRIGDQIFLLRADMGTTEEVIGATDRDAKNRYGVIAYVVSAVKAMLNPKVSQYRMVFDGMDVQCEGLACLIANMGTVGTLDLSLSKSVDPTDGMLDVFVFSKDHFKNMRSIITNIVADLVHLRDLEASMLHFQTKEITVSVSDELSVSIDGEPITRTPVTASVVPQALQLVVPHE
ncbi:MAG: hypothetical protein CUN54_08490 [Phototrophicales bacterium]|nr:MAG: hypothetical protein CUN54_08490 [Phototrophicales bacterium]